MLSGGDLRSEGDSDKVAQLIIDNNKLIHDLKMGLKHNDKLIRGRVCMTMEIISRTHPELINDLTQDLINLASKDTTPQIRWHIAEIIPNINLSLKEKNDFLKIMFKYLDDNSKIVKYCAIQAIGYLVNDNNDLIIERLNKYIKISKSIDKIINKTIERLSN